MREGWSSRSLGDFCTITKGTSPTEKTPPGPYPLVVTAEGRKSSADFQFEGAAVCVPLISSTGHGHASLKRVHYEAGRFAVANIIAAVQIDDVQVADAKYLWRVLDHFRDGLIVPLMRGTANMSFGLNDLARVVVELPPLEEQRRIVDVIESVDAYIAALEKRAEAARTARSALLHDLLSNPGPDWKRAQLDELLVRSIGGVWGSEPGDDEIDVTVVRSTEFTASGVLNFGTGVTRSITAKQLESRELREGDILVEKSGGGPLQPVGRVVIVPESIPAKFVCSNFVQLITPDRDRVNPDFLFLLMWNWHSIGRTLEYQAQTTGIRNLRTPDYLGQEIQLPPLHVQDSFVLTIGSVESNVVAIERSAAEVRRLRAALLTDLLSGNHEIPASYDEFLGAA